MAGFLRPLCCAALLGVFVIDSPQCGESRYDHVQLARRWMEEGRYDRALVEVRRALRQQGGDPDLYLLEAMGHLGQEEVEAAAHSLEKALSLDPDDERVHQVLREICRQSGRFDLARKSMERLLERFPGNASIHATLGWAYMNLGEEDEAVESLSAAADTLLFAALQLGYLYLRQERLDEAAELAVRALEQAPGDADLLYLLGVCRLRQGREEAASEAFEQAMAESDLPAVVGTRIAQAYYEQGMRRRAIEYYERILEDPEAGPLVFNNLAWAYAEEGIHLDRALDLSLEAVKADPGNAVYLDTYAEVLYRKGQPARAAAVMRRALEVEGEDGGQREYLEQQMEKFQRAGAKRGF